MLFTVAAYAQTITGPVNVCTGTAYTYSVTVIPGYTYTWTVPASPARNIANGANGTVAVEWTATGTSSVTVTAWLNGNQMSQNTLNNINVTPAPDPFITFNNQVACQGQLPEHETTANVILDDGSGCVKVCAYSSVTYYANSQPGNTGSTFNWTINGGSFTISGTTLTATGNTVTGYWGAPGTGFIKIKETTTSGCVKEKMICIDIIEAPTAAFTPNLPFNNPCYTVCRDQVVYFTDLSTASPSSPIIFWEWDFGDNSPIATVQNPSHQYSSAGTYNVYLTVTNSCGCKRTARMCITVADLPGPPIYCPSVVCSGMVDKYSTNANCGQNYQWSVSGGQIVKPTGLQPGQFIPASPPHGRDIFILWNNVGPSGFGQITLNGQNCSGLCTSPNTVLVPVVQLNGTITGPTTVCINQHYKYKLPAWPATDFKWEIINNTNGAAIVSYSENSHEIEILSGPAFGEFDIVCNYTNTLRDCGGSATLHVRSIPQATIVAPEKSCQGGAVTCSLTYQGNLISLGTSTTWSITEATSGLVSTYNSIANPATIPGSYFSSPGLYQIEAVNGASFCEPDPISIEIVAPPPPPSFIQGETIVCPNYPYTYSTGNLTGGTVFIWQATQNGSILSSGTGVNFNVQWGAVGNPGADYVSVYRAWDDLTTCMSAPITLNVQQLTVSAAITPSLNPVCEDMTSTYTVNYNDGEVYNWFLDPAFAGFGSVSAGQGTTSVTITWNHVNLATPQTVDLFCVITKCGVPTTVSYAVTLQPSPTFTLTSNAPVCEGSPVNFTVTANPSANVTGITWDFGTTSTTTGAGVMSVPFTFTVPGNNSILFPVTATINHTGCVTTAFNFTTTASTQALVNPSPEVNITPAGASVCTDNPPIPVNNYAINLSTSPFTSIQWYGPGGALPNPPYPPTPGLTSITVSNSATGPFVDENYYAIVTNAFGCTAQSNNFTLDYTTCIPPTLCTPQGSHGWTVTPPEFNLITNTCLNASNQAVRRFSVTSPLGTIGTGGNIDHVEWSFSGGPGYVSQSGGTQSSTNLLLNSPTYRFDGPGTYYLCYKVYYKAVGGGLCLQTHCESFDVEMIADFTMQLQCNGANNGYEVILTDATQYLSGHQPNAWQWRRNGSIVGGTGATSTPIVVNPGTTYNMHLYVDDADGHECHRVYPLTVPALPSATWNMVTTDPTLPQPPFSSCEGREVQFNITGTVGNITNYVWDFGDLSSSWLAPTTARTYAWAPPTSPTMYNVALEVTDEYGCNSTSTKPLSIYQNLITIGASPYTPMTQTLCAGTSASVQLSSVSGGTTPYTYAWYDETVAITGATNSTLTGITTPGAYWARITDAHGCYREANPTPATVNFIDPPPAIITGDQHVCEGENVKLSGVSGISPTQLPPGATLTYSWLRTPGNVSFNGPSIIDPASGLLPGTTYTYTLTVSFTPTAGGPTCVSQASIPVTIHATPAPPVASFSLINCNTYAIQLSATSPLVPPGIFIWSSGQSGSPVTVNHGGAYRVWVNDQWGCRNHDDLEVPLAPSSYFWRFPQNACYTFCDDFLPKQINGPAFEVFNNWEWLINWNTVNPNGPFAGSGTNSVCDPLWIDNTPTTGTGAGSGEYRWRLGNALCTQTSDPMDIQILDDCGCNLNNFDASAICIDPLNGIYQITISGNYQPSAPGTGMYNLTVTDFWTNLAAGLLNPLSGGIPTGPFNFAIQFQPNSTTGNIIELCMEVQGSGGPGDICRACDVIELTGCGDNKPGRTTNVFETRTQGGYLTLVPNPATERVSIQFHLLTPSLTRTIRVVDMTGKKIKELPAGDASGETTIDVSSWVPGMYLVQITEGGKLLETKKLVITH